MTSSDCNPNSRHRSGHRRALPVFLLGCALGLHCGQGTVERREAVYDYRSDPSEENVAKIRSMLSDADRGVRATALNALVGLRVPDAGELAVHALDDPDGFVRATAAKLIGDLGDPALAPPLAHCLESDPDPVARQRAAESLGRLGGSAAAAALAQGLEDPMERVRMACVDGLRRVDPGFAAARLERVLREDISWEVRSRAARTLGLVGDEGAKAALEAALDDPNEFVRAAAATALRAREQLRGKKGPAGSSGV